MPTATVNFRCLEANCGASTIDKNIPPYAYGDGNRIQIKDVNIVGLKRAGFPRETISAISDAHELYFRSDLSETEALSRIEAEPGDFEEGLYLPNFFSLSGVKFTKTSSTAFVLFYLLSDIILFLSKACYLNGF